MSFKFLTTIDIFSASLNKIHFANLHNKYLVKRESDAHADPQANPQGATYMIYFLY
jgi:hypothetical protein